MIHKVISDNVIKYYSNKYNIKKYDRFQIRLNSYNMNYDYLEIY